MKQIVLALAALAAVVVSGCGSKCGPSNCSGCCDASGACVSPSDNACGFGGSACQVCVGVQQCVGGACVGGGSGGAGGTIGGSSSSGSTSTSTTSGSGGSSGSTLAPNVLLVVDRSGSMADAPDNTAVSQCQQAGQQNLQCKWDELLTALTGDSNPSAGFIGQLMSQFTPGNPARLGLVTFSGYDSSQAASVQNSCAPGVLQEPLTTLDASAISATNSILLSIPPAGATPTAASLEVAAQQLAVNAQGRSGYVVLLTDGAPNCNGNFVASSTNCAPGSDRCVSDGACFGQQYAPYGCLDEDNTVSVVQALASSGVKTLVIGFGADFSNSGSAVNQTLDQMAMAGGLPRKDTNGNVLEPAFYSATSSSDLQAALQAVLGQIH